MPYKIELVAVETSGSASDYGMPVEAILEEYSTFEAAHEAAEAYLKRMGWPPGSVWYKILNEHGEDVGIVQ